MRIVIEAIYEDGVLRPLGSLDLAEHQQVQVIVEVSVPTAIRPRSAGDEDPLAGIRINTGLGDLVEHFDDYRGGTRRQS